MKLLIVADFSYGALGLSYCNAFKKLNLEIYKFDLREEFYLFNKYLKDKYFYWAFGKFFYKELNNKLINIAKEIKPDLIFLIKGYEIFPETILNLKSACKSLIFCFNPDNPFNKNLAASNDLIRKSIPYYDCYFIWGRFLIPDLIKAGAKKIEYLPFAYDEDLHYPIEANDKDRKIYCSDLAFIGSWDKERETFFEQLVNYDLAIWGTAWEKIKRNSSLRSKLKHNFAIGPDFAKICNSSKIILNHIRAQNGNAHNMKTFEIPACRGFMLTQRTDEQRGFFEENKDIACFNSSDELKQKIDYYLSRNDLRNIMKLNAYNKVLNHAYNERAKSIIDIYEKLKNKSDLKARI